MIKAVSFQIPALAVSYMSQIAASLPLGHDVLFVRRHVVQRQAGNAAQFLYRPFQYHRKLTAYRRWIGIAQLADARNALAR
jgi:hypothetical protein